MVRGQAPELLFGKGYTKVVDWWTLGILLWEMLTGLPPFYSEDVNEMYRRILYDELVFPPNMSEPARDLLVKVRALLLCRQKFMRTTQAQPLACKSFMFFFSFHFSFFKIFFNNSC